jgi:hypothetical protein
MDAFAHEGGVVGPGPDQSGHGRRFGVRAESLVGLDQFEPPVGVVRDGVVPDLGRDALVDRLVPPLLGSGDAMTP